MVPGRKKQMINPFVPRGNGESLTVLQQKIIPPVMCWLSPHPVNTPGCALCFVAMPEGTKISSEDVVFSSSGFCLTVGKLLKCSKTCLVRIHPSCRNKTIFMSCTLKMEIQHSSQTYSICERDHTVVVTAWDDTNTLKLWCRVSQKGWACFNGPM